MPQSCPTRGAVPPRRPGASDSPRPDRTLLDWVDDVAALADALGLGRFAVAGWSGGAPHALAMAYRLAALGGSADGADGPRSSASAVDG
jgi:pimeloyl-ACP methyl ester carboxylesterase